MSREEIAAVLQTARKGDLKGVEVSKGHKRKRKEKERAKGKGCTEKRKKERKRTRGKLVFDLWIDLLHPSTCPSIYVSIHPSFHL